MALPILASGFEFLTRISRAPRREHGTNKKVIGGTQKILYQVHKVKGGGIRVKVNIS